MHRIILIAFYLTTAVYAAEPGANSPPSPTLSDAAKKDFLLTAKIVRSRIIGEGITESRRITLTDGERTHDAHLQTVDVSKDVSRNARGVSELYFRDSYRFNIAAYELAEALGIGRVPVSVERSLDGVAGAVSWWVDDVSMTGRQRYEKRVSPPDIENWTRQIQIARVFDELIANADRNLGNLLITKDWQLWMIDHTRAFRRTRTLKNPKQLARCERKLFEALRQFDEAAITATLKPFLNPSETMALLVRRRLIVAHLEKEIERRGAAHVLYDTDPPSGE